MSMLKVRRAPEPEPVRPRGRSESDALEAGQDRLDRASDQVAGGG
jgi:hypothetical protein